LPPQRSANARSGSQTIGVPGRVYAAGEMQHRGGSSPFLGIDLTAL